MAANRPHAPGNPSRSPQSAPDAARAFAETAVAALRSRAIAPLDYTPASLAAVEDLLDRLRAEGRDADSALGIVGGLGCYVGEVLARHAGARWAFARDADRSRTFEPEQFVLVVGNTIANPIGKVIRRLENGPAEGLQTFFDRAAQLGRKRVA